MAKRLESRDEIAVIAEDLLRKADAIGQYPTPVDDLVAAADLSEPEDSLLSPSTLALAPKYLRSRMTAMTGRIRGLVDRREREIHIDPSLGVSGRARLVRLHEVGHKILPWQDALAHVDNDANLSATTNKLFEREATQTGVDLLFQGRHLEEVIGDFRLGLAAIVETGQQFGASFHATMRRAAETHRAEVVAIVLSGQPSSIDPVTFKRHEVVHSERFEQRFGELRLPPSLSDRDCTFIPAAVTAATRQDQIVEADWIVTDLDGEAVTLSVEVMSNTYNILVLAWVPFRQARRHRLRLAP